MIGVLTLIIAAISYSLYLKDVFAGKTKPHAITWLVSSLIAGVTFATQRSNGAGAGGWVTGFAAVMCGIIFLTALKYGEKKITRLDWYCLAIALLAILLWYQTDTDEIAVSLAAFAFLMGIIPTYRKSFYKPHQETAITFGLNGLKFLIALTALNTISYATALYPVVIAVTNLSLASMILWRRASLGHKVLR